MRNKGITHSGAEHTAIDVACDGVRKPASAALAFREVGCNGEAEATAALGGIVTAAASDVVFVELTAGGSIVSVVVICFGFLVAGVSVAKSDLHRSTTDRNQHSEYFTTRAS